MGKLEKYLLSECFYRKGLQQTWENLSSVKEITRRLAVIADLFYTPGLRTLSPLTKSPLDATVRVCNRPPWAAQHRRPPSPPPGSFTPFLKMFSSDD